SAPLRGNCRLSPTLVVWYINTCSAPTVFGLLRSPKTQPPSGRLSTLCLPTRLGVQFKLIRFPNAQRRAGRPRSSPRRFAAIVGCRRHWWFGISTRVPPPLFSACSARRKHNRPAVGCPPYVVGCLPYVVGCPPYVVGCLPYVVGCPPYVVGCPPYVVGCPPYVVGCLPSISSM
ncbi:MAG: hypothetical protein LBQ66_12960, partial [Planctomycetaceae bacterium]|nr:hypothetical protein [Planctomycetaceae bacterium]